MLDAQSDIQIDMFEVQLGAAILLQFKTSNGPVRVLADAGIKASGYPKEHVHQRLRAILAVSTSRIDLIIGTHYDEDHLNGLVPIVNDPQIEIGEAWLPPVANDSEPHAIDAPLLEGNLLAHQFYNDPHGVALRRYLVAKKADCETLLTLEGQQDIGLDNLVKFRDEILTSGEEAPSVHYFRRQLPRLPDNDCDHGIEQEVDTLPELALAIEAARRVDWSHPENIFFERIFAQSLDAQIAIIKHFQARRPTVAAAQRRSLSNLRRSAAKKAINANALHEVTQALRRRNIPIRSEIISDGTPQRYGWRTGQRRFIASMQPTNGPEIKLLGPSHSLVRKHWDLLPIEDATAVALSFLYEIKNITPSNELSYILRLGFAEQGILITGDAGCVDFKPKRGDYYPELLSAMLPLHVVQIAHHAGNNAHFYRALTAAKFPEQRDHSYLLLSHATNDAHRPSAEFRKFMLNTLTQGDDVQLLFTSQPDRSKVADYIESIHPVVGPRETVGGVRLIFDKGKWQVKAHAVEA